jgi:hypothetical protein
MIPPGENLKELERPFLYIGMTGFSPQQRADLESVVARPHGGWPVWRVGPFWEADAWWINGSNIALLPNGDLQVLAGQPNEQTLNLKLEEVDRPVAFSTPLAARNFEPACTFDPGSGASLHKALLRFNVWLQPLLFRSALGALILQGGTALRGGIYHVRNKDTLLAVLDFRRGKGAVLPNALPVDLKDTVWDKRPDGAHDLPESFLRCTPAQLVWTHARHTARDLLPPRYRTEILYYRRPPRVPMGWLRDSMLHLLSALSVEPGTFQALRERTGIAAVAMASDLACLYYSGAITTTATKATGASFNPQEKPSPRVVLHDFDALHGGSTLPPITSEPTAPAMLYETPMSRSDR